MLPYTSNYLCCSLSVSAQKHVLLRNLPKATNGKCVVRIHLIKGLDHFYLLCFELLVKWVVNDQVSIIRVQSKYLGNKPKNSDESFPHSL